MAAVAISRYNILFCCAFRWVVPGDCHVASLLAMTVLFGTSSEVFCVYRDQHFCPHSTSDLADARPPSPREKGSPLRGAPPSLNFSMIEQNQRSGNEAKRMSLRGGFGRRGNLLVECWLQKMLHIAVHIRLSQRHNCVGNCIVVPGDCHGPYGPRNDSSCRYPFAPIAADL